MPSLKALEEFRNKFSQISGEDRANVAQNIPFDDLALPDHEPAELSGQPGAPGEPLGETSTDSLDAGALLDSLGDDMAGIGEPAPDDAGAQDTESASADDFLGFGDLALGDLLGGSHNDEPPSDPGDFPDFSDEPAGEFSADGVDDFTLPEITETPAGGSEAEEDFPLTQELPDEPFADFSDDFNFDETAGEIPDVDDFNLDLNDVPGFSDAAAGTDEPAPQEAPADDDFTLPEITETAAGESEAEEGFPSDQELPDEPFADFSDDFNFGETPGETFDDVPFDAGFETESPGSEAEAADSGLPEVEDFNLDLDDMPGFSGESGGTDEGFPADESFEDTQFTDFSTDADAGGMDAGFDDTAESGQDFQDFNLEESPSGIDLGDDIPFSDDEEGFEAPGESFTVDDVSSGDDSFDSFNLDKDVSPTDFSINVSRDLVNDEIDKDLADLDEFNIPGLDEPAAKVSEPGRAAKGISGPHGGHDDVEEIKLSDKEFEKLQETLLTYPLNLRIVCGQIIVEEAVPPELMSAFINLLVRGAPAKETAALAGKILGKSVSIPKGYEKKTGEEFEAEQDTFTYIFVHKFLPIFRLYMAIALVALSLGYLAWTFIYIPLKAESIYKQGYERITAGEYNWANRRFQEAFEIHQKKDWFYRYAEAFRDERQYIDAERKYQELMYYTASKNKRGIPEKQAVLDYAALATYYLKDYEKADTLLRQNILDYVIWDRDALLALGDNSLAWGEIEPARLEDAREAYAALLDRYGQSDPVLERMLKYFILTDNLGQVIPLQDYFMYSEKRAISAVTLADLGGYLIDKRTEVVRGVPNEYRDRIGGIRDVLLRAIRTDLMIPESYYHLARYYNLMGNTTDEGYTLERAIQVFDLANEETPRRLRYHIDAVRLYAEILIQRREFFPAEEQLIKGINLYENGLSRRVISRSPEFGKLYADLGDLEYFVKSGDMNAALDYYARAERSGYSPPELRYRMGAAHYQLEQWPQALNRFVDASGELPFNRRILHALGNVSYIRGNYHAAQAYYDRLLELLNADRSRFPPIMPTENKEQLELAERLMVAQNNMGVVLEALTARTGDNYYQSRALGLYAESERAWDIITRNPETMIRMRPSPEITAPGVNPAYLNIQNNLHPVSSYEPQFFIHIDKDILEPSPWEELVYSASRISQGLVSGLE